MLAVYRCWSCSVQWSIRYAARWQLLDPCFKRDVCPSCAEGAAILSGYTPQLDLRTPPAQLELEL